MGVSKNASCMSGNMPLFEMADDYGYPTTQDTTIYEGGTKSASDIKVSLTYLPSGLIKHCNGNISQQKLIVFPTNEASIEFGELPVCHVWLPEGQVQFYSTRSL